MVLFLMGEEMSVAGERVSATLTQLWRQGATAPALARQLLSGGPECCSLKDLAPEGVSRPCVADELVEDGCGCPQCSFERRLKRLPYAPRTALTVYGR